MIISDISGKAGLHIIEAILNRERNAEVLVELKDKRIKIDREAIIKFLEGDTEHLFELSQG